MNVATLVKMFVLWKNEGNADSGNHGHSGRPGEVGGSSRKGVSVSFGDTPSKGAAGQTMGKDVVIDKSQYAAMDDRGKNFLIAHEVAHALVEDEILKNPDEWNKASDALLLETREVKGVPRFRFIGGESRLGDAMVSAVAGYAMGSAKPSGVSDTEWSNAMSWAEHALSYSGLGKEPFLKQIEEYKTSLDAEV